MVYTCTLMIHVRNLISTTWTHTFITYIKFNIDYLYIYSYVFNLYNNNKKNKQNSNQT